MEGAVDEVVFGEEADRQIVEAIFGADAGGIVCFASAHTPIEAIVLEMRFDLEVRLEEIPCLDIADPAGIDVALIVTRATLISELAV
jgi:hypothetical protein